MGSGFDYDSWKSSTPDHWRQLGLHWHCHHWRATGNQYRDDGARRDVNTDLAPLVLRDWLKKPARLIRHIAETPDEGAAWLSEQWRAIRAQVTLGDTVDDETRLGRALYELRLGQDVVWGNWLTGGTYYVSLSLVGTEQSCH
ncbi:hypothetical protein SMC26_09605 [Actinomadura fulvescens]|uniref:Uncharacterized protein n=1 Tax=Actinomadura fulvescens TaxID=46160 RepID=A0ABP6CDQ5_9ACTN